jgi:tetratricopeptide (TPR) repeat protein
MVRGSSKISDKDYESAVFYLTKAIERCPDSSNAWFNRGGAYYFMLDMEAALNDFNKALELNPRNDDTYKWRGMIHHQQLEYPQAEKDYLAYLKDHEEVFIALKLAELYVVQQKFTDAEKLLESHRESCLKNATYYNVLGMLHEEKKEGEKSYAAYSTAISLDPEQATYYMNRARLLHSLERKDEACTDWSRAADLGLQNALELMRATECP